MEMEMEMVGLGILRSTTSLDCDLPETVELQVASCDLALTAKPEGFVDPWLVVR